jgi:hypothetical protein
MHGPNCEGLGNMRVSTRVHVVEQLENQLPDERRSSNAVARLMFQGNAQAVRNVAHGRPWPDSGLELRP